MENNTKDTKKQDSSKLLSISMMGRDDDYMLDFKYRMTTTINYIARNLKYLGRLNDVEILVTDWGSKTPLAHSLAISPEAAKISRFIYVPLEVIRAVQGGKEGFHVALAINTSLRRGCGEFAMTYAADTLISQQSLEAILKLLSGVLQVPVDITHTYFLLSRCQVPWQFVQKRPNLDEWNRELFLHGGDYKRDDARFSVSAGAGSLLMSRSLWYELRGFDEGCASWGFNDVELGLRITQRYPWAELSYLGVLLFHMQHSSYGSRKNIIREIVNPRIYRPVFEANDENWGLGSCELEIQEAKNICTSEEPVEPIKLPRALDSQDVKSWHQSRQEILAELTSREVRSHVKRIYEDYLRNREEFIAVDFNFKDTDSSFFLSWYSLYCNPRQYLGFGVGKGYTVLAVGAACPSVAIYGIERWEGTLNHYAPDEVTKVLRGRFSHDGYIRFINGDISTAVQRLRDSFVGSFFFDLVFVRADLLKKDPVNQIFDLLAVLNSGGALVLTCSTRDNFKHFWSQLQKRSPQFSYFPCRSYKTGMILAASVKDSSLSSAVKEYLIFKTGWIWLSLVKFQGLRTFSVLKQLSRYPEYVRRTFGWVKRKMFPGIRK